MNTISSTNDKETFSTMIHYYSNKNESDQAFKLFNDCLRNNHNLDYCTYETLIKSQIRNEFYDRGVTLLKHMMNNNFEINVNLIEAMIKICIKTSREKEACDILSYAIDKDIELDLLLIELLVGVLVKDETVRIPIKIALFNKIKGYYHSHDLHIPSDLVNNLNKYNTRPKLSTNIRHEYVPNNESRERYTRDVREHKGYTPTNKNSYPVYNSNYNSYTATNTTNTNKEYYNYQSYSKTNNHNSIYQVTKPQQKIEEKEVLFLDNASTISCGSNNSGEEMNKRPQAAQPKADIAKSIYEVNCSNNSGNTDTSTPKGISNLYTSNRYVKKANKNKYVYNY